jgi:histidinol-phosphate aminotransferase
MAPPPPSAWPVPNTAACEHTSPAKRSRGFPNPPSGCALTLAAISPNEHPAPLPFPPPQIPFHPLMPAPHNTPSPESFIRPLVRQLHAYVPGEQPSIQGLIKLNTNENPCPPSDKVLNAIRKATDQRLRLYPNPTAQPLRKQLADLHGCRPENILIGNGSDELLALATRAFVEPRPSGLPSISRRASHPRSMIQFFTPSYSLYPVLADIHGACRNPVPLETDFALPTPTQLRRGRAWDFEAALTYITTPNAPTGRGYARADLETLCRAQRGVVILDEAYVDFADDHALPLALQYPHVLVTRTFSKAYSLCFQRVGYLVGHPSLIAAFDKIRDSYNVNGLGQIAAAATLASLPHYRRNFRRILLTRQHTTTALTHLGFHVFPSQTNFVLASPPRWPAADWLPALRARKILVRWFDTPELRGYLRITIGTDAEMQTLLAACREILDSNALPVTN